MSEEDLFEEYIRNCIKEYTTTIKGYTEEAYNKLQQENKQLKEELERNIKANIILDNTNTNYASIIFDLEEYLNNEIDYFSEDINVCLRNEAISVLNKLQELKEKYK